MSKTEQKKMKENYIENGKNGNNQKDVKKQSNHTKQRSESKKQVKKPEQEKKKKISTVYRSENSGINSVENEQIPPVISSDEQENLIKDVNVIEKETEKNKVNTNTELSEHGEKSKDEINSQNTDSTEKKDSVVKEKTEISSNEDKKDEDIKKTTKEKKEIKPTTISLSDKSDLFKQIVNIALSCEKLENTKNKLTEKNKILVEENTNLKDEKESLKSNLEATELLCKSKQEEIDKLKEDVAHRDDVIGIVKADKDESAQEFKNALAASLKTYMVDYKDLASMEMSEDVGYALVETLDGVFKLLAKNGIIVDK